MIMKDKCLDHEERRGSFDGYDDNSLCYIIYAYPRNLRLSNNVVFNENFATNDQDMSEEEVQTIVDILQDSQYLLKIVYSTKVSKEILNRSQI